MKTRNTKRFFAVLLTAVMLLSAVPLGGFVGLGLFAAATSEASLSGTCGDNLTWTFDTEAGELVISGTGDMWRYDYENAVNPPWISYISQIKSVKIGNGVTSIGSYAFFNCERLKSLSIPDSVTSIGYSTFRGCKKLSSIIIPDSVTTIGDGLFEDCTRLKKVYIGNGLTGIDGGTFHGCKRLKSVYIPNSVTEIKFGAFPGKTDLFCNGVKDVYFGGSEEQWKEVLKGEGNELERATVYFNCQHCSHKKLENGKCVNCTEMICDCRCHRDGFKGFVNKIEGFFWKIFKTNKVCQCGVNHY